MFKRDKQERITTLRRLKKHCFIGRDLEIRGRSRAKFVVRWCPNTGRFFVFDRTNSRCATPRPIHLGSIRTAMYSGRLWTCEGLRYDQILKWLWQIRLARELAAEKTGTQEPQPVVGQEKQPLPVGN